MIHPHTADIVLVLPTRTLTHYLIKIRGIRAETQLLGFTLLARLLGLSAVVATAVATRCICIAVDLIFNVLSFAEFRVQSLQYSPYLIALDSLFA